MTDRSHVINDMVIQEVPPALSRPRFSASFYYEADGTTSNTLGCFYYLGFNHNFAAATPATKPTAAGVHHDKGQAGRNGEDEDPEHRGDDAQPETGTRPRRCRYDRVHAHAGYKCA